MAEPAFTAVTEPSLSTVAIVLLDVLQVASCVALTILSFLCLPASRVRDVSLMETAFAVTVSLQE